MSRYHNQIQGFVAPQQVSQYSTIKGAVPPSRPDGMDLMGPNYEPKSAWDRQMGKTNQETIHFDMQGFRVMGYGTPMLELCGKDIGTIRQLIDRPDERPLTNLVPGSHIQLRIIWPQGYEPYEKSIPVIDPAGRSITRAHLAQEISSAYGNFIGNAYLHRKGPLDWKWTIGPGQPGCLGLANLLLVSLKHVCQQTWQAEVLVDRNV